MDLGANEWTTFRKVTLPLIAPAILAAALLGFALSIDDFVITYFNAGPRVTFPLFVWGAARVGAPPQVNVIGTAIFAGRGRRDARERARPERRRAKVEPHDRVSQSALSPAAARGRGSRPPLAALHPHGRLRRACPSSSAARAATWRTRTASATWTRSRACSRCRSATAYGEEIGEAAAAQMRELPFYTNWSYAHPRAIELAAEVASLAPGDLNRVFFVSGGSEAVESAWKLARQFYLGAGRAADRAVASADPGAIMTRAQPAVEPRREGGLAPRRLPRHDDGRALDQRHPGDPRTPFEPLVPEVLHVRNTNRYRRPGGRDRGGVHRVPARRAGPDDRGRRGRTRSRW